MHQSLNEYCERKAFDCFFSQGVSKPAFFNSLQEECLLHTKRNKIMYFMLQVAEHDPNVHLKRTHAHY